VEFVYDNYGSRALRKNRYSTILTDNNLTGQGDILTLQYQISDAEDYRLVSGRYLLPLTDRVKLGFFAARSRLALGREFREVMARGKSDTYSIYTVIDLISKDQLSVVANLGFDYKNSVNMQMTDVESKDLLRVPRIGLDIDVTDDLLGGGRTIISPEIDLGVREMFGGMRAKDPIASRVGSGGEYVKETLNAYRLQNLPYDINLLWKNSAQLSSNILTASEQFQLGGISNLRGYPSAYKVGDQGLTSTFEFSLPPYGLNPDMKVPFSHDTWAKAFRFVLFYDWGFASLHRPQAGEQKTNTLADYGVGARFDLTSGLSLSMDVAWPVTKIQGEDQAHMTWVRASQKF
jgi:hemolysin activation/secretion protein